MSEYRSSTVDQPILNDPFEEPREHWIFEEGLPRREHGRRPAGYYRTRRETIRKTAIAEQEFIELPEVNKIRQRVAEWRKKGYPGTTRITLELLKHWAEH